MNILEYAIARKLAGGGSGGSGGGGGSGGSGGGGGSDWIGDGNTHIWIHLLEDWKSPMLSVCPNGTVTVDWGDGSTPDVLTGTSLSTLKYTPVHNYEKAGDYVITLTVDGEMAFEGTSYSDNYCTLLRYANKADGKNSIYWNSVLKIEIGNNASYIGQYAFSFLNNLTEIAIPEGVESVGSHAFRECINLKEITIPKTLKSIGEYAMYRCYQFTEIAIPEGVESVGRHAFRDCINLKKGTLSNSWSDVGENLYSGCTLMNEIVISEGIENIPNGLVNGCKQLTKVVFPESVRSIGTYAFGSCTNLCILDFTKHTSIPTMSATNAFNGIRYDCQIRVPAALAEEWKAATNWSTYASRIVGV